MKKLFKLLFGIPLHYYYAGKRVTIVHIEAVDWKEKNIYLVRYEHGDTAVVHEDSLIEK
jgi:hypothetical protein